MWVNILYDSGLTGPEKDIVVTTLAEMRTELSEQNLESLSFLLLGDHFWHAGDAVISADSLIRSSAMVYGEKLYGRYHYPRVTLTSLARKIAESPFVLSHPGVTILITTASVVDREAPSSPWFECRTAIVKKVGVINLNLLRQNSHTVSDRFTIMKYLIKRVVGRMAGAIDCSHDEKAHFAHPAHCESRFCAMGPVSSSITELCLAKRLEETHRSFCPDCIKRIQMRTINHEARS